MADRIVTLSLALILGGCTHWGTTTVYGQRKEVSRRLLGAPQIAESTSATGSAGFAGVSGQNSFGANVMHGGLSGNTATAPGDDTATRLKKLEDLRRQGLITDDEYQRLRSALRS